MLDSGEILTLTPHAFIITIMTRRTNVAAVMPMLGLQYCVNIAAAVVNVTILMQFASLQFLISRYIVFRMFALPVKKTDCKAESLIDKDIRIVHDCSFYRPHADHFRQRPHDRNYDESCKAESQ